MTIEECREKDCIHVSNNKRCRNCGVTDCSSYSNYYEKRWNEEETWEFEDYEVEN